ncbi:MAG: DegT/DnrJ/EryC1/StrS family aminotransferase [Bradymonadia bacterium]
MSEQKIPITRPFFDDAEQIAVSGPLSRGWVAQGPEVQRFEAAVAQYTGAAFAVACTSATTGLHMALAALDIGPGDEIIVPAFTWVSTANAVRFCGATPVFCDIDLDTFNLDLDTLPRHLGPKTRGIIPVHLFGNPLDVEQLASIAGDVAIVEDAACALGTTLRGRHVGLTGDLGVFSFHPRKIITTGEGGMVFGSDEAWRPRLKSLRDHGASLGTEIRQRQAGAPPPIDFDTLGYNYRMTDLQGAIGVTQMEKLPGIIEARTTQAQRYHAGLADLPWLQRPTTPPGGVHSWQAYVCLYQPEAPSLERVDAMYQGRNQLMHRLHEAGIATRPGTHAVHTLGLYRRLYDLTPASAPRAWMADRLSLALPLYPGLTKAQQDYVIDTLRALGPQ